ncbi:MAG: hypothetical protein H8E37_10350 [Planctomycetes bacterium]|nr:hypothetical protein [Planctomycetota bacterium]
MPIHFVIPAAILAFVVLIVSWSYSRSRTILNRWADESGYEVLSSEFRWIFKGPYFWKSSRNQTVFRVTVTEESDEIRTGWVRCGSFWLGVIVDQTDVTWDEPEASPS